MENTWGGKRSGAGRKRRDAATCHRDKPHVKNGLCLECYIKTEEYKNQQVIGQRRVDAIAHRLRSISYVPFSRNSNTGKLVSQELYNEILYEQGGGCAICGIEREETKSNKTLAVDHCHRTGIIRGLLCGKCNSGIGYFGDNPKLLEIALAYLRRFAK